MIDFGNSKTKRPFLHQTEGERKLGIYAKEINLLKHLGDKKISHLTKSLEPSLSCSFISMSGSFGPAVGDPVRVCLLNHYRPRRQEQVWQRAETFAQHHRDRKTTSPWASPKCLQRGYNQNCLLAKIQLRAAWKHTQGLWVL